MKYSVKCVELLGEYVERHADFMSLLLSLCGLSENVSAPACIVTSRNVQTTKRSPDDKKKNMLSVMKALRY